MRFRNQISILLVGFMLMMVVVPNNLWADDADCVVAREIAGAAAKKFKSDKKEEGLKLLIMAHEYCPKEPIISYNLGLAYYQYGNLKEAEKYLKLAVEKNMNQAEWLNLLAWVMLENKSNRSRALEFTLKAEKLNPKSPAIRDTLLRAYLEQGMLYEAVVSGHKALKRWPQDKKIAFRYRVAIDAYISFYLKKTEAGQHNEAIVGLKKIDFSPEIVNARCWALYASGQTEEALYAARTAKKTFAGAKAIRGTFDQIMDRYLQDRYQLFKDGQRAPAFKSVKSMLQKYPGSEGLKEAFEKMLAVFVGEAEIIDVPPPKEPPKFPEPASGEGAQILAGIQSGKGTQITSDDLQVDVDVNIPQGRTKRPHSIAVIIGNRYYAKYGNQIPDVTFAHRDAAYMKEYVLKVLRYIGKNNIIFEKDVTYGKMARIFGTKGDHKGKLYNFVKKGKSEVFIYYSGHGAPDAQGKGAFLMPVDADAQYIAKSGYAMDTFYENLSQIPAKRITVIVDTCFSGNSDGGMLLKNISPGILKAATPAKSLKNGIVFSSTGKGEVSHWFPEKRHSLFTYFFMKGLQGEADKNKNKRITVAEMKAFLLDNVPYEARRLCGREQTPVVIADSENWEIARLK